MIQAAAAVPWLIGAGKGLLGMAAKGGASKLAGAAAGMGARQGIKRFAGANLGKAFGKKGVGDVGRSALNMSDDASLLERIKRGVTSKAGFEKNIGVPLNREELALQFGMDALFGGMTALNTPGDLGDKALAGLGVGAGGALGGLALRGTLGPRSKIGQLGAEVGGMFIGDAIGMNVADSLGRLKNGGMTSTEAAMAEQDELYRKQILDEFLAQNGLG